MSKLKCRNPCVWCPTSVGQGTYAMMMWHHGIGCGIGELSVGPPPLVKFKLCVKHDESHPSDPRVDRISTIDSGVERVLWTLTPGKFVDLYKNIEGVEGLFREGPRDIPCNRPSSGHVIARG
jgi:hypothetical protein